MFQPGVPIDRVESCISPHVSEPERIQLPETAKLPWAVKFVHVIVLLEPVATIFPETVKLSPTVELPMVCAVADVTEPIIFIFPVPDIVVQLVVLP